MHTCTRTDPIPICCICFTAVTALSTATIIPCGHKEFCYECVSKHLRSSYEEARSCPICRGTIASISVDSKSYRADEAASFTDQSERHISDNIVRRDEDWERNAYARLALDYYAGAGNFRDEQGELQEDWDGDSDVSDISDISIANAVSDVSDVSNTSSDGSGDESDEEHEGALEFEAGV